MVEALRRFDLTPFQYLTLSLANHRGDWSTAEMARRFQVAPQSMNEVVAALESKRLIVRRVSPTHRRVLKVSLTSSGVRLLQECDREIDRVECEAFESFSSSELANFRNALIKVLNITSKNDRTMVA